MVKKITPMLHANYNYEKSQNGVRTSSDKLVLEALEQATKIKVDGIQSGQHKVNIVKAQEMINKIQMTEQILDSGGSIYGMDLETLGGLKPDSEGFIKRNAVITEAAILKMNKNGQSEVVEKLAFGITKEQYNEWMTLFTEYQTNGIDNLTKQERETLVSVIDRGSRVGTALKANDYKFKFGANGPIMPEAISYDKTDIDMAALGLERLADLGDKGYALEMRGSTLVNNHAAKNMQRFMTTLGQVSSGNNILHSHNGNVFDMVMIDEIAKATNLKFQLGENSLDLFEAIKLSGVDLSLLDTDTTRGLAKLEELKKAFDDKGILQGMSHTADTDIMANLGAFIFNLKSSNETLSDKIKHKLQDKVSTANTIKEGDTFRVISGLSFRDLNGNFLKDSTKGQTLDFVSTIGADGKTNIKQYNKSALLSQNFYMFKSMDEINVDTLPENIRNTIPKELKKVFAATFKHRGVSGEEYSTIFRANKEDFNDIFYNNLQLATGVSQNTINQETKEYMRDKARRTISSFSNPNDLGYDKYYNYSKSIETISMIFEDAMRKEGDSEPLINKTLEKLKGQDVQNFFYNGVFKYKGDNGETKKLTLDKELSPTKSDLSLDFGYFYDDNKVLMSQRFDEFINTFDYLHSTHLMDIDIINKIETQYGKTDYRKNYKSMIHKKTMAYKGVMTELEKTIENKGAKVIKSNTKHPTIRKSLSFKIDVDGQVKYLNLESQSTLESSLHNVLKKDLKHIANDRTNQSIVNQKLKNILEQLNGVVSTSDRQRILKLFQQKYSVQSTAEAIFSTMKKSIDELTYDQLHNPEYAKKKIDKNIEKIKNEVAKEVELIREPMTKYEQQYGSLVTSNNSRTLITKETKKVTKTIKTKEKQIQKLMQQKIQLEDKMKDRRTLEFEKKQFRSQITQYEQSIKQLQQDITKQETNLVGLSNILNDKDYDPTRINEEISKVQSQLATQLSPLEKQKQALDVMINNHGLEIETLDLKGTMVEYPHEITKGPRKGEVEYKTSSILDYIIDNIDEKEMETIINQGVVKTPIQLEHLKFYLNNNSKNKDSEVFRSMLKRELKYSDDEIDDLLTRIAGDGKYTKGILMTPDSTGKVDLAMSMVKEYNENTDTTDYRLIFARKGHMAEVEKAIEEGRFSDKMFTFKLTQKEVVDGVEVVRNGRMTRLTSTSLDLYSDTRRRDGNNRLAQIIAKEKTTISDVNAILSYGVDDIYKYIDTSKGTILSSSVNKKVLSVLSKASSPTGTTLVQLADGTFKTEFLPNVGDLSKNSEVSVASLMNLVPLLYEEDMRNAINGVDGAGKFSKDIDALYARQAKYQSSLPDNAKKDMQNMKELFLDGDGGRYGVKVRIDKMNQDVREYITNNLIGGSSYLQLLHDSEFINHLGNGEDLKDYIANLIERGSQAIPDAKVGDMDINTNPTFGLLGLGELISPNRPLIHQAAQTSAIQIDTLEDDFVKELKGRGVTLGKVLESIQAESVIDRSYSEHHFVNGITAKMKTMADKEILDKINDFQENFTNNSTSYADNVRKVPGLENLTDKEITDLFETQIKHLQATTITGMQKTVASPAISPLFQQAGQTFHSTYIGDLEELKYDVNDVISPGDILGIDMNGEEQKYVGQRSGKIVGKEKGRFIVQELNPSISEIKINTTVSEKGVAHLYTFDNEKDSKVAQFIWDDVFGKDVSFLSMYELSKHEAVPIVFDDLIAIAQKVLNDGSKTEIDEFMLQLETLTGNNKGKKKPKIFNGFEDTQHAVKSFLYDINKDPDHNVLDAMNNIVSFYEDKMKDPNASDTFKSLLASRVKDKQDNVTTAMFSLMQMNRQYGSQIDDAIDDVENISGRGGKMTARDIFHLGNMSGYSESSRDYFYNNTNGKYEFVAQPIKDHFLKELTESKDYIDAKEDLTNMRAAILLQKNQGNLDKVGEDILHEGKRLKDVRVLDIDIDKIQLNGYESYEDIIQNTFLGQAKDYDVVAINLENSNLTMLDYFNPEGAMGSKNKRLPETSKVYVPVTKLKYTQIDGREVLMTNGVQQNIINMIDNLQIAMTGAGDSSVMETKEAAQKDYSRMLDNIAYEFENKNGLYFQKMFSKRIDFSGHRLIGGVLSTDYDDKESLHGKHKNPVYNQNTNMMVDIVDETGKTKTVSAHKDIFFMSEQSFKELGGETFFEDIGYQLAHENDFDSNDAFKKHLTDLDVIDTKGNIIGDKDLAYSKIGKEYAKVEGFQGIGKRYPVFYAESQVFGSIRLQEDNPNTSSVTMFGHTAVKLNADVDADMQQITLLANRDKDGKIQMFNKGTKVRDSFEKLMTGQAIENYEHWDQVASDEFDKIKSYTLDSSKEYFDEFYNSISKKSMVNTGGDFVGNYLSKESHYKVGSIRYKKLAIGAISNTNYALGQVAFSIFSQDNTSLSQNEFNDFQDYLRILEQTPISAKYTSENQKAIGMSGKYSQSIRNYANQHFDEGFNGLLDALKDAGLVTLNDKGTSEFGSVDNMNFNFLLEKDFTKAPEWEYFDSKTQSILKGIVVTDKVFKTEVAQGMSNGSNYQNYIASNAYNDLGLRDKSKGIEDKGAIEKAELLQQIADAEYNEDVFLGNMKKDMLTSSNPKKTLPHSKPLDHNTIYYSGNRKAYTVNQSLDLANGEFLFDLENLHDPIGRDVHVFSRKQPKFFLDTNNAIDDFLTNTVGLTAIKTDGLDEEAIKLLQSQHFINNYSNVISQVTNNISKDQSNAEMYSSMLEEFNNKIIENGRIAKDINEEKVSAIAHDTIFKANNMLRENLGQQPLTEKEFKPYYVNMNNSNRSFSDAKIDRYSSSNGKNINMNKVDESYYGIKGSNTMAFRDELNEKLYDLVNKNSMFKENSDIDKRHFVDHLTNTLLNEEEVKVLSSTQATTKHYRDLFEQNNRKLATQMGWNYNMSDILATTNLSSESDIKKTIENINILGSGKIASGRFTNYNFSSLSQAERGIVREELNIQLNNSSENSADHSFVKKNLNALDDYDNYLDHIRTLNVETNDETLNSIIGANRHERAETNYTDSMEKALEENALMSRINKMNEEIKNQAEQQKTIKNTKKEMQRRKVKDGIEDLVEEGLDNNKFAKQTLLIGAGVALASAMFGMSGGVANALNPYDSPQSRHEENQQPLPANGNLRQVQPQVPRNIYMANRGNNSTIRMKSQYPQVNDKQIANALSITHASRVGKVNVQVDKGYHEDEQWFEKAMASELS